MNDNQKQTQEQKDARAKTEERLQALEETGMSRREASFADIFGDDAFDDAAEVEGVDVDKAREIVRESRKEHEEEIARELDAQKQHRTEVAVKIVNGEPTQADWHEAERLGLARLEGAGEAQREYFVATSYAYDLARIAAQKSATNEADDNDDESEPEEVASYVFTDDDGNEIGYVVTRDGDTYLVDADWSDGDAGEFDHEPSENEVGALHDEYVQTMRDYAELDALIESL